VGTAIVEIASIYESMLCQGKFSLATAATIFTNDTALFYANVNEPLNIEIRNMQRD
jgi:hypothetical protein